jgi:hypothetical protein
MGQATPKGKAFKPSFAVHNTESDVGLSQQLLYFRKNPKNLSNNTNKNILKQN